MSQFAGNAFGIGTPNFNPIPQNPLSLSGYGAGAPNVPYIAQQLQQVQFLQQQQIHLLQHLLQIAQAPSLQYQQPQYQQQWQPFGAGQSGPIGFGLAPQAFPAQSAAHVM